MFRIVPDEDGHWLWTGALNSDGYAHVYDGQRIVSAHRYIVEHFTGRPIPAGMTVDHLCRIRHCLYPTHLEVVTFGENVLRGIGPTAVNARTGGGRRRLTCAHESDRRRYARLRRVPSREVPA